MNIANQFVKKTYMKNLPSHTSKKLDLSLIRIDGGTQSRAGLDDSIALNYAEEIADGVSFPPITVFHDGSEYWLADGFHRHMAHVKAGKKTICADVHQGTRRDAVLYSVGANATHGLQRTRADKRRAVEMLLADDEWSKWSDREIARQCAVSPDTVGRIRKETTPLTVRSDSEDRTYTTKHGTSATMDTSRIGKQTGEKVDSTAMEAGKTVASMEGADDSIATQSDLPVQQQAACDDDFEDFFAAVEQYEEDQVANLATAPSFAAATAAATGAAERTVRRDTERGEKVIPEVIDLIRGTKLDTGTYLDKLKKLTPNDQLTAAKRDLAWEKPTGPAPRTDGEAGQNQPKAKPTYEQMRAAILLLADLTADDIACICPPVKRAGMCQKLAHLERIFEQVREAASA